MDDRADQDGGLRRVPTGVPGLDAVLEDGLLPGAVYMVRGTPGAGKTILANQIRLHHIADGQGRALYVTLLVESHARMLQRMERLAFYDTAPIPRRLTYPSAFRVLEEDGLKGLMDLLRREIRGQKASLLVLDGLLAVRETSGSDREFRKFVHEPQAHVAAENRATPLLTNGGRADCHPEHTMNDGLITLDDVAVGKRKQRELEALKFRGSAALRGRHPYRITGDGNTLCPRLEARYAKPSGIIDGMTRERLSTGIPQLDAMLGGGLIPGPATMVLGASGAGETTLDLRFLSRSSAEEPGLLFGFHETPERVLINAASLGLDLRAAVEAGHLALDWRPATEQILDDLGEQLIAAVRVRGVERVFIDGVGGFEEATAQRKRLSQVFTALSNKLRAMGATVVCTAETNKLVGPEVTMPVTGLSAVVQNLVLSRFVELRAHLRRLFSILKVRGSGFDPRLSEFQITDAGLVLADTFASTESILSGFGTERGERDASQKPGKDAARTPAPRRPKGRG